MPDTYGHKPNANELLHDLARIASVNDSRAVPLFEIVEGVTPEGPIQRVTEAVGEYLHSVEWDAAQPPTPDHYDGILHIEHGLWLLVCSLLKDRGIEVNEDDDLIKTIELWGERLSDLRNQQTEQQREEARSRRQKAFNDLNIVIEGRDA